nr:type II toxin-antitoxin system RelE/ParE family toxin [Streptomyces sp. SID13726]
MDAGPRFLKEDPGGLAMVLDAIDELAHNPHPATSVPYGSRDVRRLYVGDCRVLYIIDDDVIRIMATPLGRTA